MRRRHAPPPSAQQMIRDYLGRVSVAATKVLPKGDRLLFVGRTRAAIEAQVGPLASADADDVRNALVTLGDPDVLAQQERDRLYSARRRGAAAAPPGLWKPAKQPRRGAAPPPPPARRPGPGQARRPRAWPHRGLTGPEEPPSAEPPAPTQAPTPAPAVPRQADSPEATSPPAGTPTPAAEVRGGEALAEDSPTAGPPPAGTPTPAADVRGGEALAEDSPTAGPPPAGETSADAATADVTPADVTPGDVTSADAAPDGIPPGRPSAPEEPPAGRPPDGAPPTGEPTTEEPTADLSDVPGADQADPGLNGRGPRGTPPGWMRPRPAPGETTPLSIVPGMGEPAGDDEAPAAPRTWPAVVPLAEAWALARKHPLEAVAVVLLGLGGLILPFPFWLIGGLVSLKSRRWDARDKWMALVGPPLVTLAVLIIRAATSPANFFSAFWQAAHHDIGVSIRAGCVLCAAYLVWRLRRGPRLRTLPPWQRPR